MLLGVFREAEEDYVHKDFINCPYERRWGGGQEAGRALRTGSKPDLEKKKTLWSILELWAV